MDTEHMILAFVAVAAGIIFGFYGWSFISPMLSSTAATPTA